MNIHVMIDFQKSNKFPYVERFTLSQCYIKIDNNEKLN